MKKNVITIFFCFFFIFTLGVNTGFAKHTIKSIYIFMRSAEEDKFLSLLLDELENILSPLAKVKVFDAKNNTHMQLEQVYNAVKDKPDFVLVNPVNPIYVIEILDNLKKYKIPSIFMKNESNLRPFEVYTETCFVGSDSISQGVQQGHLIQKIWDPERHDKNKDGKIQYVVLQGAINNVEAINRSFYSVNTAKKLGLSMEQIGKNYTTDWTRAKAYDIVAYVMSDKLKDIELIIANNDELALGALEYLNSVGLNLKQDDIAIVGFDGLDEMCSKIKEGVVSGTVKHDYKELAVLIKEMIHNYSHGRDMLYATGYSWIISDSVVKITGENQLIY